MHFQHPLQNTSPLQSPSLGKTNTAWAACTSEPHLYGPLGYPVQTYKISFPGWVPISLQSFSSDSQGTMPGKALFALRPLPLRTDDGLNAKFQPQGQNGVAAYSGPTHTQTDSHRPLLYRCYLDARPCSAKSRHSQIHTRASHLAKN